MSTHKLTQEQIEKLPDDIREALLNGPVTIEREVKVWEPKHALLMVAETSHTSFRQRKMLAWRAEFYPDYVMPPHGEKAFFVVMHADGRSSVSVDIGLRNPTTIYLPEEGAYELKRQIDSGEYVL